METGDKAIDTRVAEAIAAQDPWVHRSEGMRCRTCMWFVGKGPSQTIGRCRKNAPTMSGFPVVYVTDWCGQHRLDESKV